MKCAAKIASTIEPISLFWIAHNPRIEFSSVDALLG